MAARWNPPTLRTDPAKGGNVPVRCDCGRTVNADMVLDLSAIPEATRESWGFGEVACDGCVARAVREGRVTRDAIIEALGAPAAVVERLRDKRLEGT